MSDSGSKGSGTGGGGGGSGRPPRRLGRQTPLEIFAADLVVLRDEAKLTRSELAKAMHYSPGAVSKATAGVTRPSWKLTEAYVRCCGGDVEEWQRRWERVGPDTNTNTEPEPEAELDTGTELGARGKGVRIGQARLLWLWRRRPRVVVAAGAVVVVVLAGMVVLRVWDRPVRPDTDATVVDRVEFDPAPGIEWSSALPACEPGAEFRSLTLASSADKNRPLAELAGDYGARLVGGECVAIRVMPANSGEYAKRLSGPWNPAWGARPDVWVPASSVWLRLARHWAASSPEVRAGLPDVGEVRSVVTSPLVMAMPKSVAERLGWSPQEPVLSWHEFNKLASDREGWAGRRKAGDDWAPFTLGKTNPWLSGSGLNATVGQYLGLTEGRNTLTRQIVDNEDNKRRMERIEKSIGHYSDTTLTFLAAMREAVDPAPRPAGVPAPAAGGTGGARESFSAIMVEESSMIAYNEGYVCGAPSDDPACAQRSEPAEPLVAFYPAEGLAYSDHPYFVMPGLDDSAETLVEDFLQQLRSKKALDKFAEYGFRDHRHRPTALITSDNGTLRDWLPRDLVQPDAETLDLVLRNWRELRKPANVLVVLDTSGSMAPPEEGGVGYPAGYSGPGKLALVQQAAGIIAGKETFTDKDRVGLWHFSLELQTDTPGGIIKDYKVDVEIGELGERLDGGVDRRGHITAAIARLKPEGATGLYDTTKAAVDYMRAHYQPDAINAVVLLTDGMDTDTVNSSSGGLQELLNKTLPADPLIRVFTIAYGTDTGYRTDGHTTSPLQAISIASGGRSFDATQHIGDIGFVFAKVLANF